MFTIDKNRVSDEDASGDSASAMREKTPAHLRQQCQCNKGDNASAMRSTMPAQPRQQRQHNEDKEDTIAMTTKTCQRCQHDKGENASVAWATMPAQRCSTVAVGVVVTLIVVGLCCCLLQG